MYRVCHRGAARLHDARWAALRRGAGVEPLLPPPLSATAVALTMQRRHSFKYASKLQHNEMRQPFFNHEKQHGIFSNEHNIAKSRRGLPFITPLDTKHMNLWSTDTDASTNRFFRAYLFGQRELHQLLGRPHDFSAAEVDGSNGLSAHETNTDMRYKGIPQPAITNLHFEPEWNHTIYRAGSHGAQLSNPRSPLTAEILGPELLAIRDVKSVEECKAWFDRLQYLIRLHYDAVGDIGEFKSRHTQHVHEFFMAFTDAISGFDFQDAYLLEHFKQVRPVELEDLFGIFLEMEANYVNVDHCPRCSLPFATTRYCGEGDTTTPFRKHRGRWAPHQRWGKEWFDVVCRRAEALWYRATEDPFFGTAAHTQLQVEALLRVYVNTKQRGKAISFLHNIRGSKEFLTGAVIITDAMQKALDGLLDSTAHPHLLTNAYQLESGASKYTGEVNKVPQSPMQLRLDLEMDKYRRQQREEGVVRVPPAQWKLDTSSLVAYKLDAQKHIVNWREVKEGIERSFLSTGLPREAYASGEWREMLYLADRLGQRAAQREKVVRELEEEKALLGTAASGRRGESAAAVSARATKALIFPDSQWYRVFDVSTSTFKPFGVTSSGQLIHIVGTTYSNPRAVPYVDAVSGVQHIFDTTPEACRVYGDFHHGQRLRVSPRAAGDSATVVKATHDVIVVGVNTEGAESEWGLCVMYVDKAMHAERGVLSLGKDVLDVRSRWESVLAASPHDAVVAVPILAAHRTQREESLAQVVGVRHGVLYVQWHLLAGGGTRDRSVAMPLGTAEYVGASYRIADRGLQRALEEPPSWRVPFRNDWSEERLKELQRAPFEREKLASLVAGKFTPKKKRFGYAQHTTQDDFVTKEYKDRLVSKQFFHSPQSFEVLPDAKASSVAFGSKLEYLRTNGVPSVDRNELENGWGEFESIPDDEVAHVEQALRDISGRRPGNFFKAPAETQKLRLNESWWKPLELGWEQHNREQLALLEPSEQRLVNNSALPFRGGLPPFGASFGIGERLRDIASDYAKGFGLGPHGHSPGHDTTQFNSFGVEDSRVRTIGYDNAIVRLFNEKLGDQDIHLWAVEQCAGGDADPRKLLLSVSEWRAKGRQPSPLLVKVLTRYLASELAAYNDGLPDGVPRLALDAGGDDNHAPRTADGNIWVEVDKTEYAIHYAERHAKSISDEPYILTMIYRANLPDVVSASTFSDAQLAEHLRQSLQQRFMEELARIVGVGIPAAFAMQKSAAQGRNSRRSGGTVAQLVKGQELGRLLSKMGVSSQTVTTILRGLSNSPDHSLLPSDFVIPTATVLTWAGPSGTAASPSSAAPSRAGGAAGALQIADAVGIGRAGGEEKQMVRILDELAKRDDGLALDVRYVMRENRRNPHLRSEFFLAMLPVYAGDTEKVARAYEDYCLGKFVPNVKMAIDAFVKFLAQAAAHPELLEVEYFNLDPSGRRYTGIKLLLPSKGPFVFDCVSSEHAETMITFSKYGISAGPTRAPLTYFIAPGVSSVCYVANRKDDIVPVTSNHLHGLRDHLTSAAAYKQISSNPKFQLIVEDRDGGVLAAWFNFFFYRTMPMLSFYHSVVNMYNATQGVARDVAANNFRELSRILEAERSTPLEQEFRRNTERYWRNILDGKGMDELGGAAPGIGFQRGSGSRTASNQQSQSQRRLPMSGNFRGSGFEQKEGRSGRQSDGSASSVARAPRGTSAAGGHRDTLTNLMSKVRGTPSKPSAERNRSPNPRTPRQPAPGKPRP